MLADSKVAARIPVHDTQRARSLYAGKLGLEASEERPGGLLYRCVPSVPPPGAFFARRAHAVLSLDTTRNTGYRGDTRSNSASGASLSIGRCALALVARCK